LGNSFQVLTGWVKPSALLYGVAAGLGLLGLALGAVHRDFAELGSLVKLGKGSGILLVSFAGFLLITLLIKPSEKFDWRHGNVDGARADALREKKPLLVDFTAAWCGACKELDKVTFSAPEVRPEMARFVAVKVDATNDDDPAVGATLSRFHVVGLPTVVIFDSSGREALRYTDFVEPKVFLDAVQRVN
jgi:thiol:disulfide interchange protein DsbD